MVNLLLSVTFACGLLIAAAHVVNRPFVAPVYDVLANLTAFTSATAASVLLEHWTPATLSAFAVGCWLVLGRRTLLARRSGRPAVGVPVSSPPGRGLPSRAGAGPS